MNNSKTCTKCILLKSNEHFYKNARYSDGLDTWCKSCRKEYSANWNKEKRVVRDPVVSRKHSLKHLYGITPEQFESLLDAQGGKCAVCPVKAGETTRNFHVDHDHSCCPGSRSCGKCVRGLLCHSCNVALGLIKDSPETLKAMINYLEQ